MKRFISLGIETTAHTFAIGIIADKGEILADERSVYKPPLGKGIIPHEARDHHKKIKEETLNAALKKTNLNMENIDIISYSAGPGLPPCLLVGADYVIELAKKFNKPLIPVNHCVAHLEIGKLMTKSKNPVFLYLSGGNTQVIAFVEGIYRIFGETEDVSVGNCLDTVAREMGLAHPGGPEIERLAKNGKYTNLPYVVKGMDVSFSGIATASIKLFKEGVGKEDIAYSLQETCFSMLTEVTERALAHIEKEEVLLVGGVAVNRRLQEMIETMCKERGARMYVVPQEYGGDQGVMIAWTGMQAHKHKIPKIKDKILQKWRIDQVPWFQE